MELIFIHFIVISNISYQNFYNLQKESQVFIVSYKKK